MNFPSRPRRRTSAVEGFIGGGVGEHALNDGMRPNLRQALVECGAARYASAGWWVLFGELGELGEAFHSWLWTRRQPGMPRRLRESKTSTWNQHFMAAQHRSFRFSPFAFVSHNPADQRVVL